MTDQEENFLSLSLLTQQARNKVNQQRAIKRLIHPFICLVKHTHLLLSSQWLSLIPFTTLLVFYCTIFLIKHSPVFHCCTTQLVLFFHCCCCFFSPPNTRHCWCIESIVFVRLTRWVWNMWLRKSEEREKKKKKTNYCIHRTPWRCDQCIIRQVIYDTALESLCLSLSPSLLLLFLSQLVSDAFNLCDNSLTDGPLSSFSSWFRECLSLSNKIHHKWEKRMLHDTGCSLTCRRSHSSNEINLFHSFFPFYPSTWLYLVFFLHLVLVLFHCHGHWWDLFFICSCWWWRSSSSSSSYSSCKRRERMQLSSLLSSSESGSSLLSHSLQHWF